MSNTPEAPPITPREVKTVFAGLMLALTLASLDQNIVGIALPQIVSDLGGLSHLSWVVTAFLVTSTATTPLYGKLSDMYGRKPLFIVAILIFLVGSCLCGLSRTMVELVVFRAIQGLGAGGLMVLAMTTIADLVAPRERGRYQGLFGAVFAFSSIAGPLLGGFITDALSWRWIFYVNVPIGIVALALIGFGFRRPHKGLAPDRLRRRVLAHGGHHNAASGAELGRRAVPLVVSVHHRACRIHSRAHRSSCPPGTAHQRARAFSPDLSQQGLRDRLGRDGPYLHGPLRRIRVPAAVLSARPGVSRRRAPALCLRP